MSSTVKPTLVCTVWSGGASLERYLTSIASSKHHFHRIVLSITSNHDSGDMRTALQFQKTNPEVEVLCTGRELPTMQHQAFWVDYLQRTGTRPTDWIYWLAYDDQIRSRGIEAITDAHGNWPLTPHTAYFGPWAIRHAQTETLWHGDPREPLESWTSIPEEGPTRLPVVRWIADQLRQPTYMQMSGSVNPFASFLELRDGRPTKQGPVRIEMAISACRTVTHVEEFEEPSASSTADQTRTEPATASRPDGRTSTCWPGWRDTAPTTRRPRAPSWGFSLNRQPTKSSAAYVE